MHRQVGAQNVCQHRRVPGVGLGAGLAVSFSIAGNRARVDRVHREPGLGQRHNQEVLVGFDGDRRVPDAAAVFGDQGQ